MEPYERESMNLYDEAKSLFDPYYYPTVGTYSSQIYICSYDVTHKQTLKIFFRVMYDIVVKWQSRLVKKIKDEDKRCATSSNLATVKNFLGQFGI